jgi:hypothetical protein
MEKEMLKAGAYTTRQLIAMEKDMWKAKKDFDIGLPYIVLQFPASLR